MFYRIDSFRLKYVKTISEYVWYDDNRGVDNGWLDYSEEEKKKLFPNGPIESFVG